MDVPNRTWGAAAQCDVLCAGRGPTGSVFQRGEGAGIIERSAANRRRRFSGSDGVILFSELIVNAAAECGKLDELAAAAKTAVNSPDTVDTFSVLTAIASPRDPRLAQQAAEYVAALQQQAQATGQVRLKPWPTYVVARAWMRSDIFRSQGEALGRLLADHATGTQQRSFVSYLHRDLALSRVQQVGGTLDGRSRSRIGTLASRAAITSPPAVRRARGPAGGSSATE